MHVSGSKEETGQLSPCVEMKRFLWELLLSSITVLPLLLTTYITGFLFYFPASLTCVFGKCVVKIKVFCVIQ